MSSLLQRLHLGDVGVEHPASDSPRDKKQDNTTTQRTDSGDQGHSADSDAVDTSFQRGVQNIEAITKVWTKTELIVCYVLIWVIYFVDSMQQGTTGALTVYVTSSFQLHSLTAATSVMSSLISGLWQLPLAKIIDIWGRPQGFAMCLALLVIGLIMMAACRNVETYAAAQVFYWTGYTGLGYVLSVFVADTSSLKNRAFAFALISSPYILTVWMSGPMATAFLAGPGFRWSFGVFAIVTPIVCAPFLAMFTWNSRKARKMGVMPKQDAGRTWSQSVRYYLVEFDILGLALATTGLALFLLPFSIYSYQTETWRAPIIISFIIIGGLLLVAFGVYEARFAPKTFIPFHLLKDRTVLGGCILSMVLFVEFYIWDSYFFSFLQVVNGLSITHATYVGTIYTIGSSLFALVVGVAVRWSGKFKWIALYFGVPVTILGVALMIAFRGGENHNIGYIVMCQIFIAFGGGALVICEQMAVMAATSHQYVAVVLAVEAMFTKVGGAIGSTVSAAIWTGTFPRYLAEYLPEEAQANLASIYGDITVQLSYPIGSPTRDAINRSYAEAQKWMLVSSTAILAIGIVSVVVWRDLSVNNRKQTKGTVL